MVEEASGGQFVPADLPPGLHGMDHDMEVWASCGQKNGKRW